MTIPEQAVEAAAFSLAATVNGDSARSPNWIEHARHALQAALPLMGVQRPEAISPSNPLVTIAGIRQFGLASDGSDLRNLEAAFTRLALPHTEQPQEGLRVRHNKRGTEYEVIGSAFLQTDTPLTDMEPLVVYRDPRDGHLWARPEKEFTPDRFTLRQAAPASPRAEGK